MSQLFSALRSLDSRRREQVESEDTSKAIKALFAAISNGIAASEQLVESEAPSLEQPKPQTAM